MIIRCPECTTNFRLPEERIDDGPTKLRCSNCGHVFRAGLVDGEPTAFDEQGEAVPIEREEREKTDADEEGDSADASSSEPEAEAEDESSEPTEHQSSNDRQVEPESEGSGGDQGPAGSKTESEGETAEKSNVESREADESVESATGGLGSGDGSNYDPFPHAGSEASPEASQGLSGGTDENEESETQPRRPESGSADLQEPEPSEKDEEDGTAVEPQEEGDEHVDVSETSELDQADESAAVAEGSVSVHPEHGQRRPEHREDEDSTPDRAAASESDEIEEDLPQDDDSIRAQQKEQQQGRQQSPAGQTSRKDEDREPFASPSRESAKQTDTGQQKSDRTTDAASRSSDQSTVADDNRAADGLAESSSTDDLALDEVDRLDSQQFQTSGFQKFSNVLLILLIVATAFLVVVAAQNKWFVDFKKFDQMVRVAFQGGSYTPRDEWAKEPKIVRPPKPDNPIELHNVFAQVVPVKGAESSDDSKPRVLVLRGEAENVSKEKRTEIKLRGIVYDRTGKVEKQATAKLGADIANEKIRSVDSVDKLSDLLPNESVPLSPGETQPFTILFDSVPPPVAKGTKVDYRVEIAESQTSGSAP